MRWEADVVWQHINKTGWRKKPFFFALYLTSLVSSSCLSKSLCTVCCFSRSCFSSSLCFASTSLCFWRTNKLFLRQSNRLCLELNTNLLLTQYCTVHTVHIQLFFLNSMWNRTRMVMVYDRHEAFLIIRLGSRYQYGYFVYLIQFCVQIFQCSNHTISQESCHYFQIICHTLEMEGQVKCTALWDTTSRTLCYIHPSPPPPNDQHNIQRSPFPPHTPRYFCYFWFNFWFI